MAAGRRKVRIRVLPGQPTDGTGTVCIHLFVPDPAGPFVERHVLRPRDTGDRPPTKGDLQVVAVRGRLACDPRRTVDPVTRNGVTEVTMRTDAQEAVTCPKCRRSKFYTLADKES